MQNDSISFSRIAFENIEFALKSNLFQSIIIHLASIGAFTFELEMHKDQSFAAPYTSYPVTVNVNDKLYFQVKASVEDNGLVLLIDKCYSTPIMDRNDYRKYTFIENG